MKDFIRAWILEAVALVVVAALLCGFGLGVWKLAGFLGNDDAERDEQCKQHCNRLGRVEIGYTSWGCACYPDSMPYVPPDERPRCSAVTDPDAKCEP